MQDTPKAMKTAIRATALARRDALPAAWRIESSLAMAETAKGALDAGPGTVASGFWPIRSEVDPRPILFDLRGRGARICLPAILDRSTMIFRELTRDGQLVDMGFGTAGPGPEAEILDPDLMIVPLAAFDARGHRIGYGAGYYDRAISKLVEKGRLPKLVGIAFDCQEVERVPDEPHDIPLAAILTESGLRTLDHAPNGTDTFR